MTNQTGMDANLRLVYVVSNVSGGRLMSRNDPCSSRDARVFAIYSEDSPTPRVPILIITDAWLPQINGVVRSIEALVQSALGVEIKS